MTACCGKELSLRLPKLLIGELPNLSLDCPDFCDNPRTCTTVTITKIHCRRIAVHTTDHVTLSFLLLLSIHDWLNACAQTSSGTTRAYEGALSILLLRHHAHGESPDPEPPRHLRRHPSDFARPTHYWEFLPNAPNPERTEASAAVWSHLGKTGKHACTLAHRRSTRTPTEGGSREGGSRRYHPDLRLPPDLHSSGPGDHLGDARATCGARYPS
mmetsp:Transcript_73826/g.187229  ORF Transcript_73826/g.187229 Transcript_73826/m.187229 type:complete len:214 (+) Transcript_73826:129-770(+)